MLIVRFKLMSRLDLAEQHARQQGETSIEYRRKTYQVCVSTEPTAHGEKLRLRFQAKVEA